MLRVKAHLLKGFCTWYLQHTTRHTNASIYPTYITTKTTTPTPTNAIPATIYPSCSSINSHEHTKCHASTESSFNQCAYHRTKLYTIPAYEADPITSPIPTTANPATICSSRTHQHTRPCPNTGRNLRR